MFGRRGEKPVVPFWSTLVRVKHVDVVAMPEERLWAVGVFLQGCGERIFGPGHGFHLRDDLVEARRAFVCARGRRAGRGWQAGHGRRAGWGHVEGRRAVRLVPPDDLDGVQRRVCRSSSGWIESVETVQSAATRWT